MSKVRPLPRWMLLIPFLLVITTKPWCTRWSWLSKPTPAKALALRRIANKVKHSTKKPFRQKGTGRARAGMTSSPLWRGGGRIFPNMPDENFTHKLNKKMYRAGMAAILSQLAREGRLSVVESIDIEAPKTKLLAAKFKAMGLESVMLIANEVDDNLLLASRNLPNVLVCEPRYADPLSLVFYKKILVTKAAMEQLQEMLA